MKEEQGCVKQLGVTLSQCHSELDKRFEEIQTHKDLGDANLLKQEIDHWERHNGHLQRFLDQKETYLRDLLDGPDHILLHNLLKDMQYWREKNARLTQFTFQDC